MRALLAPVNREIPAFAGMEEEGGNGKGGEWKRGGGNGDENRGRERKMGAEIKKKVVAGV